jgi:hypothetical protein
MNLAPELHQRAMELIDRAMTARLAGETQRAEELLREAYDAEKQAAHQVAAAFEPSRSILLGCSTNAANSCEQHSASPGFLALMRSRTPCDVERALEDR